MEEKIEEKKDNEKTETQKKNPGKLRKELMKNLEHFKKMQQETIKLHEEFLKMMFKFNEHVDTWDDRLKRITETNVSVEETLRNMFLAIRQNEYLQAWYPAQQGLKEMKVVGRHPCQAKTEI